MPLTIALADGELQIILQIQRQGKNFVSELIKITNQENDLQTSTWHCKLTNVNNLWHTNYLSV